MAEEFDLKSQDELTEAEIPVVDEEFAEVDALSDEDTDKLVAAIAEALRLAGEVADTEEALEERGVEAKGAGSFARSIRAIADAASSERVRTRLNALAVVVSMSHPDEWRVLAGILERAAPKDENAKKIADKMRSEGSVGYAQPNGEYPGPQEKSSDGETDEQAQAVQAELKSLGEQIGKIARDVDDLREQVAAITKALSTVAAIAASDVPAPQTRQTPGTSVAAALLGTLKPGS